MLLYSINPNSINAEELDFTSTLSADEINIMAFSRAPIFRKPTFCLFATVGTKRVHYHIGKIDSASTYDSDVIYESTCLEDILDVWACFK